jgi:hypothetical protein
MDTTEFSSWYGKTESQTHLPVHLRKGLWYEDCVI